MRPLGAGVGVRTRASGCRAGAVCPLCPPPHPRVSEAGPHQFCLSWGRASLHLSSSGQESRCWSWDYKQMLSGPVCKHTVFQWGSRVFSSPRQQLLPFTPNPSSWPALRVPVPPGLAWGPACGATGCPDAY